MGLRCGKPPAENVLEDDPTDNTHLMLTWIDHGSRFDDDFVPKVLQSLVATGEQWPAYEPRFRGRSVWDWIDQLSDADESFQAEAIRALLAIGPPVLLYAEWALFSHDLDQGPRAVLANVLVKVAPEADAKRAVAWLGAVEGSARASLLVVLKSLGDERLRLICRADPAAFV
jgi:hypothetical protein